jgi:hypothetical protein
MIHQWKVRNIIVIYYCRIIVIYYCREREREGGGGGGGVVLGLEARNFPWGCIISIKISVDMHKRGE